MNSTEGDIKRSASALGVQRTGEAKGTLLYITTTLPALTVTFIYRELFELEARGWKVFACSMNTPPSDSVSLEAAGLVIRTLYLDRINRWSIFCGAMATLLRHPGRAIHSLVDAMRPLELCGARGAAALLFHFVEAAYLARIYGEAAIRHIHCHFGSGPASIGMFVARFLGVGYSFAMHGTAEFVSPTSLTAKLRRCKFAVAISEYMRTHMTHEYGQEFAAKIEVVHCGIPLGQFEPRQFRAVGERCEILSVGQLQRRKGYDTLLDTCVELRRRGFLFRCRIVGDGPERIHLKKLIELHGLDGEVVLQGAVKQEEIVSFYRTADLFVLTCAVADSGDRDGIPVALMEGMAIGLPVISTTVSGIPELITSMEEGILIEPGNARGIADAIVFLASNPVFAEQIAYRGRVKVRDEFDLSRTVDQLEKLLLAAGGGNQNCGRCRSRGPAPES